MRYSIVDVPLSILEQELADNDLHYLVDSRCRKASQTARSLLRLQKQDRDTVIVYRLPVMLNWADYPKSLEQFKESFTSASIACKDNVQFLTWSSKFSHQLELIHNPNNSIAVETIDIDDMCQSELLSFVKDEEVLFEHAGAAQFYLPSEQTSDYFLRVGNMQSKSAYFSAVFFWTLPVLKNVIHIFGDTWSISTTAAVMSDYLKRYGGVEEPSVMPRTSWSFAPSYIPKSKKARELASDAAVLASLKGKRTLFLSSFYSSGSLGEALVEETINSDSRDAALFVAIFGVKPKYKYCDLLLCCVGDHLDELGLGGKGAKYDASKELLNVGKSSYIPDYRSSEPVKFLFEDIQRDNRFFANLVGKGIFSVHRNGNNSYHDSRHHAFHIDAAGLFSTSYFRGNLREKFAGGNAYHNIIVDGSEGAEALLKALEDEAPQSIAGARKFIVPDWRKLPDHHDVLDAVNDRDKRSLYLVPVVISGSSLGDLKKYLRKTSLLSLDKILFLVGLLRPSEPEVMHNYTVISDKYVSPSKVIVVTNVFLPNWGLRRCPWCREQDILDRKKELIHRKAKNEEMARRHEKLQSSAGSGLVNEDVFFTTAENKKLPFNGGSLFANAVDDALAQEVQAADGIYKSILLMNGVADSNLSEGDLCVVVASAIQNWRIRTARKFVRRPTIDSATVASDDKFNEARLRAALWRALAPEELSLAVRGSTDFESLLERIFSGGDDEHHECLELEAMLAFPIEIRAFFSERIES